eukprot:TRINITY_DN7389_c0_g1_i3.p1 TRINITY_DN7389_c0_g1~~TRINITY_DN7389_c0_g1_i3.p1  ORF type:complete len:696 (+),score=198.37 TRINITY_DN7389_c0_g1_i3:76-2163(+)
MQHRRTGSPGRAAVVPDPEQGARRVLSPLQARPAQRRAVGNRPNIWVALAVGLCVAAVIVFPLVYFVVAQDIMGLRGKKHKDHYGSVPVNPERHTQDPLQSVSDGISNLLSAAKTYREGALDFIPHWTTSAFGASPSDRDQQESYQPDAVLYCPRDPHRQKLTGSGKGTYKYVAIGLARTWDEIDAPAVKNLAELNCKYNIPLDIVVTQVPDNINEVHLCDRTHAGCAPIKLYTEPEEVRKRIGPYKNRVARIARVRDSQREALAEEYKDEVVKAFVVIDLDLVMFPRVEAILQAARDMADGDHSYDGVCALGLDRNQVGDDYYDTFATVFADGTWAYPKKIRFVGERAAESEDKFKVVSRSSFGSFTQWDVTQYLRHQASLQLNRGLAPVLSCFGGAAVYKASKYLSDGCEYEWQPKDDSINKSDTMWLYADLGMERACEHVVLHFCMAKKYGSKFAIDPRMVTAWKSDPALPPRKLLVNEGNWHAEGKNVLGTFRTHYEGAWLDSKTPLTLENGAFKVRVSDQAELVIENRETKKIVWRSAGIGTRIAKFQHNWEKMLLILGPYGELLLLQQVEESYPENRILCRPFDDAPAPRCRLLLWRLDGVGAGDYALMLTPQGHLEAKSRYFEDTDQVVNTYWSSAWDPADPNGKWKKYLYYSECYQLQCDLLTNRDWNRVNREDEWDASKWVKHLKP